MTAVRPPIHNLPQVLDYLVLGTGLAWAESCPRQLVAISDCRRFTYSIEAVQITRYTALVEYTPLVVGGTLAECIDAINDHQATRR